MENKKAQNITVTTIIIIVLALVVLVVLILGFTGGWSQLWGRITEFFGSPNVDSVVQSCQVACTAGSGYDYCMRMRNVVFDDKKEFSFTCYQLEETNTGLEGCGNVDCSGFKLTPCENLEGDEERKGELVSAVDEECPNERKDLTSQVTTKEEVSEIMAGKLCCEKKEAGTVTPKIEGQE